VAGVLRFGRNTQIPTGYTPPEVANAFRPAKVVIVGSTRNTLVFGVVGGEELTPITVEAGTGMQILLIV
jgi:hypothetical protein